MLQINCIITTVHENAGCVAAAPAPDNLRSMETKAEGTARPGYAGFRPEKWRRNRQRPDPQMSAKPLRRTLYASSRLELVMRTS